MIVQENYNQNSLICLPSKIHDKETIIIFYTGSQHNCVSKKFAEKFKFPIREMLPKELVMADRTVTITSKHCYIPFEFLNIPDQKFKVSFLIINRFTEELLL
ncbi:hypothetical protein DMUE_3717 [Dictyocoela muelleri]|nr:hypothetical protein DMUE_3717 [Dictyocoela muelleri]